MINCHQSIATLYSGRGKIIVDVGRYRPWHYFWFVVTRDRSCRIGVPAAPAPGRLLAPMMLWCAIITVGCTQNAIRYAVIMLAAKHWWWQGLVGNLRCLAANPRLR